MNSINIDSPEYSVPRFKLNHFSLSDPFSKPSNNTYLFNQASDPNLELLKELFYNDLRRLSSMKDGFMILPTDISSEVDLLKDKVLNALDSLERFYKKEVKGKAQENVQKMVESIEKAGIKRLTLTPYFEPTERVVLEAFEKALAEGLRLFEEEEKDEEEKKRLKEEQKRQSWGRRKETTRRRGCKEA
ncbi:hypothetical protein A2U01_0038484 [Trifolium medium]|uniref:Uncharacterized protein n=1 Tax=Trifolium medium TaxID=97028 RepID=A0A392Q037_9FABA|nr:hypothetical protein [Trifolium medium]